MTSIGFDGVWARTHGVWARTRGGCGPGRGDAMVLSWCLYGVFERPAGLWWMSLCPDDHDGDLQPSTFFKVQPKSLGLGGDSGGRGGTDGPRSAQYGFPQRQGCGEAPSGQ
jgi:hypothetical protein